MPQVYEKICFLAKKDLFFLTEYWPKYRLIHWQKGKNVVQ